MLDFYVTWSDASDLERYSVHADREAAFFLWFTLTKHGYCRVNIYNLCGELQNPLLGQASLCAASKR